MPLVMGARGTSSPPCKQTNLRYLDLSNNAIYDEGAAQIADALRNNAIVTCLKLHGQFDWFMGNCLRDEILQEIDDIIYAHRHRNVVLTVSWSPQGKDGLVITCTNMGGMDLARLDFLRNDSLHLLKHTIVTYLQLDILVQDLRLVPPDGKVFEDVTGEATLGELL